MLKNTFHVPQCVLWQRGPPSLLEQTVKTGRNRIPDQNYLRNFTLLTSYRYTLVQGQIQS